MDAFYAAVDFLGDDARAKGAPQGMTFLLGDDVRPSSNSMILACGAGRCSSDRQQVVVLS